jgi:hypothetical protein
MEVILNVPTVLGSGIGKKVNSISDIMSDLVLFSSILELPIEGAI